MKPIYTLLAFLGLPLCILAQTNLEWTNFEYTPHMQRNECKAMCTNKAGITYVVNQTQSAISYYISDRFFAFDEAGTKLWQYDNDTCLTGCSESYNQVVALDGGGAIFVGIISTSTGNELSMKRLDAAGVLVWEQNWADGTIVDVVKAKLDSAGDLVVAMNETHITAYDLDYEIAKFDTALGSNIWHTTIPPDVGSDGYHIADEMADMVIGPGNVIYGCGTSGDMWSGTAGHHSFFRVAADGTFGYRIISDSSTLTDIETDRSGGVYIFGEFGPERVHLEKRNATDGALLWQANPAKGNGMNTVDLATDDAGNVYALSNFYQAAVSNRNFVITKYNTTGTKLWQRSYLEWLGGATTSANTGAVEMHKHNTGLYILSSKAAAAKTFIVVTKVDMDGNVLAWDTSMKQGTLGINRNYDGYMSLDSVGNAYVSRTSAWGAAEVGNVLQKFADTTTIPLPTGFTDRSVAAVVSLCPNPASNQTTFSYPEVFTTSSLQVFDVHGRMVVASALAGRQTTISTSALETGVYFCRLMVNGELLTAKLAVTR